MDVGCRYGSRFTGHGSRVTGHGSRFTDHGSRFTVHGSRHYELLVSVSLPFLLREDLVDRLHGGVELRVARIEVRCDANAGTRTIVDDHVAGEQRLRHLASMRDVE